MLKIIVWSIFILPVFTITLSGSALSATIPDNAETDYNSDTSNSRSQLQYHLVTLPSTNKKRVDAMSARFISLVPKAMLISKTPETTVYRLIANRFDSIESAKKRQTELLQHCKSPFVVKSDQVYSVIAGSLFTETSAAVEQKRMAGKNIPTAILKLRLPLKHWQIKSTESFDIRDAVNLASKLDKMGVTAILKPTDY
jgi:hypothetical protein